MSFASPRNSGEELPRADCVPAASGLTFRPSECGPKPVRFFNRPSAVARIPRDSARNRRARTASQPHLAWLFALQSADQNLSAFFSRKTEASYPAMNSAPLPSDLFPDFSPVPQMVFVNERVSFQTEGNQRVILVHGVVHSHYSREDRTADTDALVSLY